MDERRKKAYRLLLYKAMLSQRGFAAHDRFSFITYPAYWRMIDLAYIYADVFRDLAKSSSKDFEGFEEDRFWQDVSTKLSEYPERAEGVCWNFEQFMKEEYQPGKVVRQLDLEELHQKAYRYLLYRAMVYQRLWVPRSSNDFYRQPRYWREIGFANIFANALHNLAKDAASGFEGFDEDRCWGYLFYHLKPYPGRAEMLRSDFEKYLIGEANWEN